MLPKKICKTQTKTQGGAGGNTSGTYCKQCLHFGLTRTKCLHFVRKVTHKAQCDTNTSVSHLALILCLFREKSSECWFEFHRYLAVGVFIYFFFPPLLSWYLFPAAPYLPVWASCYVSALSKQTSNNSKLITFIYLGRLVLCCHMTFWGMIQTTLCP